MKLQSPSFSSGFFDSLIVTDRVLTSNGPDLSPAALIGFVEDAIVVPKVSTHPNMDPRVAKQAVSALLDQRDLLGLMVEFARGNVDQETMDEAEEAFTSTSAHDEAEIRAAMGTVASLAGDRLDAELIATVFRCDYSVALKVLRSWECSGG